MTMETLTGDCAPGRLAKSMGSKLQGFAAETMEM
jgi:hypothetical protein